MSRLAMDVVGSGLDQSGDPKFIQARAGKTYFSPISFRKESRTVPWPWRWPVPAPRE